MTKADTDEAEIVALASTPISFIFVSIKSHVRQLKITALLYLRVMCLYNNTQTGRVVSWDPSRKAVVVFHKDGSIMRYNAERVIISSIVYYDDNLILISYLKCGALGIYYYTIDRQIRYYSVLGVEIVDRRYLNIHFDNLDLRVFDLKSGVEISHKKYHHKE